MHHTWKDWRRNEEMAGHESPVMIKQTEEASQIVTLPGEEVRDIPGQDNSPHIADKPSEGGGKSGLERANE